MKKGELQLNRWHFKFGLIPCLWMRSGLLFHFGIFKMIAYPSEGEIITKKHYKGFWLRYEIRNGFEINF